MHNRHNIEKHVTDSIKKQKENTAKRRTQR